MLIKKSNNFNSRFAWYLGSLHTSVKFLP
jgi:hypothetical protein